ncbi:MAG TPA: Rv3235 family protein [Streptosporangiaceae bacterium]|jgi:hypothetical protein
MQQTPHPQLPWQTPDLPAGPGVGSAVRTLIVPAAAPPFDDDPDSDETAASAPDEADKPTYSAAGDSAPPGSGGWPSQFAQVVAETLAGSRPARQLAPWTTEQARRRISQLGPILMTDQRPRVRRIVTSAPSEDVLELTAVVGYGPRVRALALRLERGQARPYRATAANRAASPNPTSGERWYCTAIESA